jgi:hypothetical protein
MIRGEKHILKNLPLKIYLTSKTTQLGEEKIEITELFSGSEAACKKYGKLVLTFEPGDLSFKKLSKELKGKLKCSLDDLPKFLPTGCKLKKN